jgi:3-phosphoshikimate 1-carboxyvinyltransferase
MKQLKLIPLQNPVTKTIEIPGSKSYTNRALLMAALTKNPVTIHNPLKSDDTIAMIDCLMKLGIEIEKTKNSIIVKGSFEDVKDGNYKLNANLAATAIRFLLPLLTIIPGTKVLQGNEGLNKRPIGELVNGLKQLGAEIEYLEKDGYPPLKITSSKLNSNSVHMKGDVSSQFFSALFMIAPVIGGLELTVDGLQISKPYIDMTIDGMKKFGIEVTNNNYKTYIIKPNQSYDISEYIVEGDFSSAGYFFAIAALTESTLTLKNLNPDSLQADKKFISVVEEMGSIVTPGKNEITIEGKGVKAITIDMIDFPDQAQTVGTLAAFANDTTMLTGLQSLHVKETDRLKASETELNKMGIKTKSTHDSLTIYGGNPKPAIIDTYGDQRTAMSFAVAGAKLEGILINDPDVVNKTFPEFWNKLAELGIKIERTNIR